MAKSRRKRKHAEGLPTVHPDGETKPRSRDVAIGACAGPAAGRSRPHRRETGGPGGEGLVPGWPPGSAAGHGSCRRGKRRRRRPRHAQVIAPAFPPSMAVMCGLKVTSSPKVWTYKMKPGRPSGTIVRKPWKSSWAMIRQSVPRRSRRCRKYGRNGASLSKNQ